MAQPTQLDDSNNPMHEAYACLLANGLERLNKELKRRTRVATLFPNPDSCMRLVSALLAEQDEEWLTAKIYLTMET